MMGIYNQLTSWFVTGGLYTDGLIIKGACLWLRLVELACTNDEFCPLLIFIDFAVDWVSVSPMTRNTSAAQRRIVACLRCVIDGVKDR